MCVLFFCFFYICDTDKVGLVVICFEKSEFFFFFYNEIEIDTTYHVVTFILWTGKCYFTSDHGFSKVGFAEAESARL